MFTKKEITGLILAPLAGAAVFIVYLLFLFKFAPVRVDELLYLSFLSVAFSYAGMIFVGIPIIIALKKNDDLTLIRLVIFGGGSGALIYPFFLSLFSNGDSSFRTGPILFGLFEGILVALLFGIISNVKLKDKTT